MSADHSECRGFACAVRPNERQELSFLKAEARLPEATQIYVRLREAARERWDIEVFESCSEELHWIQDEKGGLRPPLVNADQMGFSF